MIDHDYVTMKLVNGDNIICVLVSVTEESYIVVYPLNMKSMNLEKDGKLKEVSVGKPWCNYSDDPVFEIFKQDVITLKPMNKESIRYYKNIVDMDQFEEDYAEELNMNSNVVDVENINEFSDDFFFIPGNKTVH